MNNIIFTTHKVMEIQDDNFIENSISGCKILNIDMDNEIYFSNTRINKK